MSRKIVWCMLVLVVAVGCTPRVKVRKNPSQHDTGVRYYRPKPYLLVTPSGETKLDDKGKPSSVSPSDQFVSIEVRYLPDFSEEYSINVTPGLGSANVKIELADGWNLTSLNQELDTQFDENVKAIAELTKAAGGLVGTAGEGMNINATVSARNVPIGLYEAVIGHDACGRKQLYGWRYIGFTPFATCPTFAVGSEYASCNDGSLDLYGLVFENGIMTFRRLHDIQNIPPSRSSANSEVNVAQNTGTEAMRAPIPDMVAMSAAIEQYLQTRLNDPMLRANITSDNGESALHVATVKSQAEVERVVAEYMVKENIHMLLPVEISPPLSGQPAPGNYPELPSPNGD